MKSSLALLVWLFAAVPLCAADADTAFDPKEKITVELKDAKIADLVTTLGALANMPVYVDPDVSGTISIRLADTPFEDVLKAINASSGVFVRIENGKLVASRSTESLFAALTLPERFRGAPRVRVSDVSRKSPTSPVSVRTDWNGERTCHRLEFAEGERPTITLRVGQNESAPALHVTQFSFDPVSRASYLALDGAGLAGGTAVVGGGRATALTLKGERESLEVLVQERADGDCKPENLREVPPQRQLQLFFSVREIGSDGAGVRVMSPSVALASGTTFKMRTGLKDEKTGQQRELVLSGYVSPDGAWVAVHLMATAIWIDPADGSEYFYTQSSAESSLSPVTSKGVVAATVPAGVATPRALELTVLGPENTSGTADPTKPPMKRESSKSQ